MYSCFLGSAHVGVILDKTSSVFQGREILICICTGCKGVCQIIRLFLSKVFKLIKLDILILPALHQFKKKTFVFGVFTFLSKT